MNNTSHTNKPTAPGEHGTTASYVIGFVLSLVFTFIPYYMVVNKSLSGSALLASILGFAIVQMFIQIFFFLHLGRGPKPFYNVIFFFATAITILVVVGGSVFIMNNLYQNMSPEQMVLKLAQNEAIYQVGGEKTGACQGRGENHKVTIKGGAVSPFRIEARLCDTLTFINEDDKTVNITFGQHLQHISYAGEYEVSVYKGRPASITLNETGEYLFHDHLDPAVTGNFSVEQ